jgi:hypothetical protein
LGPALLQAYGSLAVAVVRVAVLVAVAVVVVVVVVVAAAAEVVDEMGLENMVASERSSLDDVLGRRHTDLRRGRRISSACFDVV